MDYKEIKGKIQVPSNVGVEGFLTTIREILGRPRVQEIHVDSRGEVTYRYFVREGTEEERPLGVDFDFLLPGSIIRNGEVEEVTAGQSALATIAAMFDLVAADHFYPVAFVAGANSSFWGWYSLEVAPRTSSFLFGLPFVEDRSFESNNLFLCTTFGKGGALIDVRRSYLTRVPDRQPGYRLPDFEVDVG
jgi:hypothetical protein